MGPLLLLLPAFLAILALNHFLVKKGRPAVPEEYAVPIGLLGAMFLLAFDLGASLLVVIIFSGFGFLIAGTAIEFSTLRKSEVKQKTDREYKRGFDHGYATAMIEQKYGKDQVQILEDGTPYVSLG